MALEIERKFLVSGSGFRSLGEGTAVLQGYISLHPDRIVRVRIAGDRGSITFKKQQEGITRLEYEYSIPLSEAQELLEGLCLKPLIQKVRYRIQYAGKNWEVDEFLEENAGLVVAEIELKEEGELFEKPEWLGPEVSDDPRYLNANLAMHPYCEWGTRGRGEIERE